MSDLSIKKKTINASVWSLIDNLFSQGFVFLIGIVLARILSPSDYGTVGVLAIFIAIANTFVDCGFANALIRKKDRTQNDLSTAFYFNFVVGVISYVLLYVISPFVANFFSMPILIVLLRVLGLRVIFNSFSLVQNALLTSKLNIKTQAIINIFTQIPVGCLAIFLAYKGMGVWTLVIQQVGSSFLKTIWLWIIAGWRPSFVFSKDSFDYLFHFGWKLVGASLLGTFFNEIYGFVVGRFLGAEELGFYSKSKQLSEHPRSLVNNVIHRVVLPVMVEVQGDDEKIKEIYRKLIRLTGFLVFPFFGFLILIAEPLILIIWTEKWYASIFLFQLFCFGMSFGPISSLNFCLLELLNRTDLTLKLEFVKKPVCLSMLLVSIPFGLSGIVIFASLYNCIGTLINMYPTFKLLKYSYKQQLLDLLYGLILTIIVTGLLWYPVSLLNNLYLRIITSLVFFVLMYYFIPFVTHMRILEELKQVLLNKK